jgi:hypothetical protein
MMGCMMGRCCRSESMYQHLALCATAPAAMPEHGSYGSYTSPSAPEGRSMQSYSWVPHGLALMHPQVHWKHCVTCVCVHLWTKIPGTFKHVCILHLTACAWPYLEPGRQEPLQQCTNNINKHSTRFSASHCAACYKLPVMQHTNLGNADCQCARLGPVLLHGVTHVLQSAQLYHAIC